MIYVIRNGGSDQMIAPSKTVHIHGEKGIVKGVFGWPAIHTRSANPHERFNSARALLIWLRIFVMLSASTERES
jgi:putative aminopeptidase FrvX